MSEEVETKLVQFLRDRHRKTPLREMAQQFGMSIGSIWLVAKKYGIPLTHSDLIERELSAKYDSYTNIAERVGVCRQTVQQLARKLGYRRIPGTQQVTRG